MKAPFQTAGFELILELRLDYIQDPDLEKILSQRPGKVIVTNRRREEGGLFRGTEEERVGSLFSAVALGADYVDIEASTDRDLISDLKKEMAGTKPGTKLIISSHDFQSTPSEDLLRRKLDICEEWTPEIVKIATMANSMEDNLRVLNLIPHARRRGLDIIAFCMGSIGRISRVMSPFMGAYLSFAALDMKEATAPGQMAVGDMLQIFRLLGATNPGAGVIDEGNSQGVRYRHSSLSAS